MRGLSKKMLISILTSVVVFVTMIATTFAWVGIFTYANTDKFNLNLKVQDLDSNYYLTISSSGKKGTFSSEVDTIDIERQVVENLYGVSYQDKDNSVIDSIYKSITLAPVTTNITNTWLDNFWALNYKNYFRLVESKAYLKFDLYLSVDTKEGISGETTGIKSNVLFSNINDCLEGTIASGTLLNGNPFIELPSNPVNDLLKTIPDKYTINSKNAVRFALSLYDPIEINSDYSVLDKPVITKIFEGGNEVPSYDITSNTYDLGGCLSLENNLAAQELLVIRPNYYTDSREEFTDSLNLAIDRNDLELTTENNHLWNKHEHEKYLGCMDGVLTKMKISVYLWFEGWDSDCLRTIVNKPVTLNLSFTSGVDD